MTYALPVVGPGASLHASVTRNGCAALAIVPASPDALIGLADSLVAGGKTAEAEQTLRRAIAVQPRYPAAQIAYGSFLFSHGRPAEAVAPYVQARQLAVLPLELGVGMESFGIVRRRGHLLSPAAQKMLDSLRTIAQQLYAGGDPRPVS